MFRSWKQATLVLMIAGFLLLLIPSLVLRFRSEENAMICASNMRQLVMAVHNYHSDWKKLPLAVTDKSTLPFEERLGWMAIIYPHIESDTFNPKINWTLSYHDPSHREILGFRNGLFLCRSSTFSDITWGSYVGISGIGSDAPLLSWRDLRTGALGYQRQLTMNDINAANGTQYTMLLGETERDNGPWYGGGHSTLRAILPDEPMLGKEGQFSNSHQHRWAWRVSALPLGQHFGMVDGNVRSFGPQTSRSVLEALAAYRSGQAFTSLPWDE
jgi:hypothetical protein